MGYFNFEDYIEKVSGQCSQGTTVVKDVLNGQMAVAGIELAQYNEADTWIGSITIEDNCIKLQVSNEILERVLSGKVLPEDIVRKMINS